MTVARSQHGRAHAGRGRGESETSPRRLAAAERQRRALELRKAGLPYTKIAEALEYSDHTGAIKAVRAALQRTLQEPADELRRLELERCDALIKAIWRDATSGDLRAIDRVLNILHLRAKLAGTFAPTKIAPTDPSGEREYGHLSDEQLLREIGSILDAARAREAGAATDGGAVPLEPEGAAETA